MKEARHLLIHGHVQGVGYRASLTWEAERLGVTGWVRNRRDGTVEAMIQGGAAELDLLVAWARRGPPGARVTRVDAAPGEGDFDAFRPMPTV